MGASRHVMVALLALVVVAGSCGRDSGVSPVDTAAPSPPIGIQVMPDGSSLAKISWEPNTELDLAGYKVYRSSSESGPFGLVTPLTILCPWCYAQTTTADVTYFKVTAVDRSGNESAYSQIVAIYINDGRQQDKPSNSIAR